MAATPEEFSVEGIVNPPPSSPSIFLDVPLLPNGDSQGPLSPDDMSLSYITRMLMEEDTDDNLLCPYYDHQALLQVQQPFAQILSSASFSTDNDNNVNKGKIEGVNHLLQSNIGYQSTLDLAFSTGVDVAGAFLKGMEEANMLLPRDNNFSRADNNPSRISIKNNPSRVKKRYIRDEHLEEVIRARKATMMMKEPEEVVARKMFVDMMLRGHETCIMGIKDLSIAKGDEVDNNRNSISKLVRDVVDLRTLLILCAQAVTANNPTSACDLLRQIKKHASATGDPTQRLAHCFAKGLEARLLGTGSQLWQFIIAERPSVEEFLRAYNLYMAAGCFLSVTIFYSIRTVMHAMVGKNKLHIVDYGPHYGFHLAGLLRLLSSREDGPPEVRITAIGQPYRRSCPAEHTEEIGCRLSMCAREFGLPFKFHAIAKKSEDVCVGDLNIDANEVIVVNDLFNLSTLMDESIFFDEPSPRDIVLNNIKNMRPNVFIQSIVNYSYGTSFLSRFRDALFYYTSLFDMLDATIPRGSKPRLVLEQGLLGRGALNAIACEGVELIDRPEKYRQWQARNQRSGLKQLPLKADIVKLARAKVKKYYHKDFFIGEDGQWLLQGWKGRTLFAHSTWVAEDASSE